MPADLDAVADELYALPREEFTAARNAAVKRARAQGDRELAERIGALRRPSTAAWLANLLSREHPDEVRAPADLGDGLRAAQDNLEGDALRRLSRQRHQVVYGLVEQARRPARSAGHPVSDAVSRELEDTFTAAVNSSAAAEALGAGRLTVGLDPSDGTGPAAPAPGPRHGRRPATTRAPSVCAVTSRVPAPPLPWRSPRARTRSGSCPGPTVRRTRRRRPCGSSGPASRTRHVPSRRPESAQHDLDATDRAVRDLEHQLNRPDGR